ncbi:MAG: exodeoxyribonuclease VII small subunit [Lentisphaerae bacterium]|nr:exodeoxyribonuclease VII small subunit [Lentisphaerota bacterium]
MKKTNARASFEQALERLEKIVHEMESGTMSLAKMMQHFEEGMGLVRSCSEQLNEVEQKIEILIKKNGQTTTAPFALQQQDEAPAEQSDQD